MTDETPNSDEEPDQVAFNLSKENLLSILQTAAGKERCVVEFRTIETEDGGRQLDSATEITEHVSELERRLDAVPPDGEPQ